MGELLVKPPARRGRQNWGCGVMERRSIDFLLRGSGEEPGTAAGGGGADNKGLVVGEGDQAAIQQFQRRKVFAEQLFADPPEL